MSSDYHSINETCACGAKLQVTSDNYGVISEAQKRFHDIHKGHGDALTTTQVLPPLAITMPEQYIGRQLTKRGKEL